MCFQISCRKYIEVHPQSWLNDKQVWSTLPKIRNKCSKSCYLRYLFRISEYYARSKSTNAQLSLNGEKVGMVQAFDFIASKEHTVLVPNMAMVTNRHGKSTYFWWCLPRKIGAFRCYVGLPECGPKVQPKSHIHMQASIFLLPLPSYDRLSMTLFYCFFMMDVALSTWSPWYRCSCEEMYLQK